MKKLLSAVLTLALLLTGLPVPAAGASTPVTHYRLDTGVIFIWSNSAGVWQKGRVNGEKTSGVTALTLTAPNPTDTISNVNVVPFTLSSFSDDYNFNNLVFHWNPTAYANDQTSYRDFYLHNGLTKLAVTGKGFDAKTGKLNISWGGTLSASNPNPINVKDSLRLGMVDEIYAMMGVTADTVDPAIKTAMETLYPSAGQSEKVEGFLYFVPLLISYDVTPEEVLPLMPPKCILDCKASSAFIGMSTPVRGLVTNQNPFPVIMKWEIQVNGVKYKGSSQRVEAKKSITISDSYPIPASAKPGTRYAFQIKAWNIAVADNPPPEWEYRYWSNRDGERIFTPEEWQYFLDTQGASTRAEAEASGQRQQTAAFRSYVGLHTLDASGCWYKTAGEWKEGVSNICPRTAVPQPDVPLDHSLNPAVIVD